MADDMGIVRPEHVGMDSLPTFLRDIVDLNLDIAGVNVSRIPRFLTNHEFSLQGQQEREKAKNDHLTRIQLLMLDEAYREAYLSALETLEDVRGKLYEAMTDATDKHAQAKALLHDALENASTLPDGTKVFLDGNTAYTEDGEELTEEEFVSVTWRDDAPSWSEFKALKEDYDQSKERLDLITRHTERFEEIEQELDEHPDETERVKMLEDELLDIKKDIHKETIDAEFIATPASPQIVPDLSI